MPASELMPAGDWLTSPGQLIVDVWRQKLATQPQVDCPITDRWTPGLYTREIFMPSGTFIISKIHKTEHPFVVMSGHAAVWIEGQGVVQIKAPFVGITKPNTRRVLYVHEDCVWLTFHPTTKTTVAEVEADIIQPAPDVDLKELDPQILNQLLL